jgi:pentatricopeptide repeat protein
MIGKGVRPTAVSFISLLNACSHAGCVKKGLMLFALIIREYDHLLSIEHYACVVDLLGRAGLIDKAVTMTRKMPVHPDAVVWYTILAASRKWQNVELGRYAFEQTIGFDEFNPWACILMYQIYASLDMPEEASKIEAMRRIVFLD